MINGNNYYRIINKLSGFGLLPEYSGTSSGSRGMHHWPMGESGQNQEGFEWLIIPVPNEVDTYWIINKLSGFGLLPEYSGASSGSRGMHHWPMGESGQNQEGFKWKITKEDGWYIIVNKISGFGLLPEYSGTSSGSRGMHHWPMGESGQNQEGFKWKLEKSQRYYPRDMGRPGAISELGPANIAMKGKNSVDDTKHILISSTKIPFMFIKDNNLSYDQPSEQIKETPYYRLNTYHYWSAPEKLYIGNSGGKEPRKKTLIEKLTNSKDILTSVSKTISSSVSVTASVGVEIDAFSASTEVTATTSRSTTRTNSQKLGVKEEITIQEEVVVPVGHTTQIFVKTIYSELLRADGTKVDSWNISTDKTDVVTVKN